MYERVCMGRFMEVEQFSLLTLPIRALLGFIGVYNGKIFWTALTRVLVVGVFKPLNPKP